MTTPTYGLRLNQTSITFTVSRGVSLQYINSPNAMIYVSGFRKAMANANSAPFRIAPVPTVSLNLADNQTVPSDAVTLTVNTSGNTRSVKYYYDWHFIGESFDKANKFRLTWNPQLAQGSQTLITAVAVGRSGQLSKPSAAGDKLITLGNADGPTGCDGPKGITYQRFDNITGVSIDELISAPIFPDNPTATQVLNSF